MYFWRAASAARFLYKGGFGMNSGPEELFEVFLEKHMNEYEAAETALFTIVRTAFIAGWNAAGGTPHYDEDTDGILGLLSEIRTRESSDKA